MKHTHTDLDYTDNANLYDKLLAEQDNLCPNCQELIERGEMLKLEFGRVVHADCGTSEY